MPRNRRRNRNNKPKVLNPPPTKPKPRIVYRQPPKPKVSKVNVGNIQHPKANMQVVSSSSSGARIVGREMLGQIFVRTLYTQLLDLQFNPGFSEHFPRMAGIASTFQRYRVHKLQLHFHSMSSSIVSGQVLLLISLDPEDIAPGSLTDAFNYECQSSTSAFVSVSTPNCKFRDKQYLVANPGNAGYLSDPTNYYPCNLWAFTERATTDDDSLAVGVLSLTYDIEFFDARPISSTALVTAPTDNQDVEVGGHVMVDWGETILSIGKFGLNALGLGIPGLAGSTTVNSILVGAGEWLMSYIFGVSASSMEDDVEYIGEHKLRRNRSTTVTHYDPAPMYADRRKRSAWTRNLDAVRILQYPPMTADDMAVQLVFSPSNGDAYTAIQTDHFNVSGATSIAGCIPFTVTEPGYIDLHFNPNTGETRTIYAAQTRCIVTIDNTYVAA